MTNYRFMVGSYAPQDSNGIYCYELDTQAGILQCLYTVSGVENPSFILMHPNKKVLYAVEERNPEGRVAVFIMENGQPQLLTSMPSQGADPCHLAIEAKERFLTVANYTSGSLGMFRLDEMGIPICMTEHRQHEGHSIYKGRQEGPHVHFSKFVDTQLYICDLGLDRVIRYELDPWAGSLEKTGLDIEAPRGCGPRHLTLHAAHPGMLYVITEMGAEILVYRKEATQKEEDQKYKLVQRISLLPEGCDAGAVKLGMTGAAVKFTEDGKILVASARIFNLIISFRVCENGTLERVQALACGGSMPRDFEIFGDHIIVANQESGNLSVIQIDTKSGALIKTEIETMISNPSCILKV